MAHHYQEFTMDMNSDLITDEFALGQDHTSQLSNISEFPKLARNDPLFAVNKDHMYGIKLQTYGCISSSSCLNQSESTQVVSQDLPKVAKKDPYVAVNKDHMYGIVLPTYGCTSSAFLNQLGTTAVASQELPQAVVGNIQSADPENDVDVQNQYIQTGDFEESLIIDDPLEAFLAGGEEIQMNGHEGTVVMNESNVVAYDEEIDSGVEDALQFIQSQEEDESIEFVALDSEKKRNPPYLIKDSSKITTKNDEPIKFRLRGASVCQVVMVTLKYTEEKFKNNPVTACRLHSKEEYEGFNFELSPVGETEVTYEKINEHPTVHFTLKANSLDFLGDLYFYTTFRCLNSCHKGNGKKMEIIFKLMDPVTNRLIKENRFEVRACKNVKRDYKEAFQEEGGSAEKHVLPESFISQEEPQVDQPGCSIQEAKRVKVAKAVNVKTDPVSVVMIKPSEEQKTPERRVMDCLYTPVVRTEQPEFHIVRLPTLEKQRVAFDMLRLLGGEIMKLESVSPVEGSSNLEQEGSAP